jgi:hypothetical protein
MASKDHETDVFPKNLGAVFRRKTRAPAASALLFGCIALGQAIACSSTSQDESSSPASTQGQPARAAGDPAHEIARAQAIVEARYPRSAVQHSFRSRFGETVDCVDFFAQAGVRTLAERGTPITKLPSPARRPAPDSPLSAAAFDGSSDEDGHVRRCSDTTVPQLRVTVEDIERIGGVDRFLSLRSKTPYELRKSSHEGVGAPDGAGPTYAHVQASYAGSLASFQMDTATLSIWTPNISASQAGDHSLEQTWTLTGGQAWSAMAPCAPNCLQTVEAGWTVDPGLNAANGATSPHLFIYSTFDGYQTGCYNGNVPSNLSGSSSCPVWIATPGATLTPGQTLTSSNSNTSPPTISELVVEVSNCNYDGACPGGWRISANGSSLGYYASSNYSGTFLTAATTFTVGGEVDDVTDYNGATKVDTWTIPMGSGAAASAGYGKAGYAHDFAVWTLTPGLNSVSDNTFGAAGPTISAYGSAQPPAGASESRWANFFYLGAPCVQRTCSAAGSSCGAPNDGCEGALSCGTCPSGQVCVGNTSCCTPKTVAQACPQNTCGHVSDGCGGTITCPACPTNFSCDASTNTCTPNPICFPGCPPGFICEGPAPGVCVANHRCPPGEKYCNGRCIVQSAVCR